MYYIMICDDDTEYVGCLKKSILKTNLTQEKLIFTTFSSGEEMQEYLHGENICCDLLIMDMHLPGMDGNEAAKIFRKRFPYAVLAFCSGVKDPTDKEFQVGAFRYLYKTNSDVHMLQELKDIMEYMKQKKEESFILGFCGGNMIRLKPRDILYIEIAKHGSRIYVRPGINICESDLPIISKEKVAGLYEKLEMYGFAYAHNSYIVNLNYVGGILGTELVLESVDRNGEEEIQLRLGISRSRLKEFKDIYARWLGAKY